MAKPYRTKSSKGPGGTIRYTTQYPNGKPTSTMSYKMGSSTRVAVTRNGNGSVVQRTTQKTADGYTKRTTKTLVSKPKTIKASKSPKMPKLKTSVLKEPSVVKFKTTKQKTTKSKPFKWPKFNGVKSNRRKTKGNTSSFTFVKQLLVIGAVLTVLSVLFS